MTSQTGFNDIAKGMTIMAGCMLVLPVMDAIAKYMAVSVGMSPAQVTFYRFFFRSCAPCRCCWWCHPGRCSAPNDHG